jgi:hypothetical protein
MKDRTALLDFIIVGAAKSGTTALYKYLHQHPEIFLPKIKEPRFFCCEELDEKHIDGAVCKLDEYVRLFHEGGMDYVNGVAGEATPAYFDSRIAPYRIKELVPNVKLICILRNPVDKSWSGYMMYRRDEGGNDDYVSLLDKGRFISGNKYSENITRYLKLFSKE